MIHKSTVKIAVEHGFKEVSMVKHPTMDGKSTISFLFPKEALMTYRTFSLFTGGIIDQKGMITLIGPVPKVIRSLLILTSGAVSKEAALFIFRSGPILTYDGIR
jgi:hypothetical protein